MELVRRFAAVVAGAALSLVASDSAAQAAPSIQSPEPQSPHLTPRTPQERERIYQNLHHILLNVQVFDASGKPDTNLKVTDFTILQDHQPQKIAEFQAVQNSSTANPSEVILVLDTVNNSSGKIARFRKEIEKYLKEADGPLAHLTALALLSNSGIKMGDPSTNRAALLDELNDFAGNLHSITCADTIPSLECNVPKSPGAAPCDPNPRLECLNHQFNTSVPALTSLVQRQAHKRRRTIVIWIGQSWPLLNDNRFIPDTPEVKDRFFHDLVEVSNSITEANVTLDAVSSSELLPINPKHMNESVFVTGVPDQSKASAASLALQAFAYQSGGLVLASTKDIAAQIARCVSESESYYVLTFDAPPASRYGEYHSVAVKVDQPGRTVRTRTIYYGEQ